MEVPRVVGSRVIKPRGRGPKFLQEGGVGEEKAEGHAFSLRREEYLHRNRKKHGLFGDWQEAYGGDRGSVTLLRYAVRFWKV